MERITGTVVSFEIEMPNQDLLYIGVRFILPIGKLEDWRERFGNEIDFVVEEHKQIE